MGLWKYDLWRDVPNDLWILKDKQGNTLKKADCIEKIKNLVKMKQKIEESNMSLFSNEPRQMNIMLTEEDFVCLVRGGVLTVNSQLKIALQDIGFDRMYMAIESAELGVDIQKPRDREND